jgi:hypothetical protein
MLMAGDTSTDEVVEISATGEQSQLCSLLQWWSMWVRNDHMDYQTLLSSFFLHSPRPLPNSPAPSEQVPTASCLSCLPLTQQTRWDTGGKPVCSSSTQLSGYVSAVWSPVPAAAAVLRRIASSVFR